MPFPSPILSFSVLLIPFLPPSPHSFRPSTSSSFSYLFLLTYFPPLISFFSPPPPVPLFCPFPPPLYSQLIFTPIFQLQLPPLYFPLLASSALYCKPISCHQSSYSSYLLFSLPIFTLCIMQKRQPGPKMKIFPKWAHWGPFLPCTAWGRSDSLTQK